MVDQELQILGEVSVFTSKGPLKGQHIFDRYCRTEYYSFKMIPYAHIPIGTFRFAPPKEIISWSEFDVLDRTVSMGYGKENVLLLNIYTPEIRNKDYQSRSVPVRNKDRPVIVFVPEDIAATSYCALDRYGPQYLIEKDVVVVIVSYRVGIMGFLKFDDPQLNAPGDVGLMDLKMAFAWIRNDIGNFGGCSNNITAYGQGLGANHIHKLLMSPFYENCFDKAILSSWFEHKSSSWVKRGRNYNGKFTAQSLFRDEEVCENNSLYVQENYLAYRLRKLHHQLLNKFHSIHTWIDTTEVKTDLEIQKLLAYTYRTKIPVIIGYNSQEAAYDESIVFFDNSTLFQSNVNSYLVRHGATEISLDEKMLWQWYVMKVNWIMSQIMFLPAPNCEPNYSHLEILSDKFYFIDIMTIAENLAIAMAPEKVYLYRFNVNGSPGKMCVSKRNKLGAGHGDELSFIFKFPDRNYRRASYGKHFVHIMTEIWSQFAKTGNPNPSNEWIPIGKRPTHCLNILIEGVKYCEIPEINRL